MMKSVIIAGREISVLTIALAAVIFYFGVIIDVLHWSVPELLSESMRMAVVWFSIGAIIAMNVEKEEPTFFEIMWMTPKIICNKGVFTWNGSSRRIISAGVEYTVFYGGMNALGMNTENGTVFICPSEMVETVSKNKLIKAKLEKTEVLAPEFKGFSKTDFIMFGNLPDAVFGDVTVKEESLADEITLWKEQNKRLEEANSLYMKLISDKGMVNSINNPEIMQYIDQRLKE